MIGIVPKISCQSDVVMMRPISLNFRIYNATGGIILEVGRWDKTRQEWTTNMHIINEDEEHKTDTIAKIMTLELMK